MLIVGAVGVIAGALVLGSQLVRLLGGALQEAAGRGWREALVRADLALAALSVVWAVICARIGAWNAPAAPGASAVWAVGHAESVAVWLGVLGAFALRLRGAASGARRTSRLLVRASWRVWGLAVVFLTIAGGTGVMASRSLSGWPALVGTRYGRLLLLQSALLAAATLIVVVTGFRLRSWHEGADPGVFLHGVARLLLLGVALGLPMVIVAVALTGLARGAGETTSWPFRSRLAPDVMLQFPSVREEVVSGTAVAVGGLLALIGTWRVKRWRPLLIVAGILFLAIGVSQALSAMSIDAYPTTYARPLVESSPGSIQRGRQLFAVHCAPCHGRAGHGDGPAGAGLLQRPADLTAPHTADHTPGDLFWWITHGLGLAMPAFGDRLSDAERWDLVNFVRALALRPDSPARSR